jgi:hypothetical protein
VISVAIICFFANLRTYKSTPFFLISTVVFLAIIIKTRQTIFIKRQPQINLDFVNFLNKIDSGLQASNPNMDENGSTHPKNNVLMQLEEERKILDDKFISIQLLMALTIARIFGINVVSEKSEIKKSKLTNLKKITIKSLLIEILLLLIIMVPFMFISFLFTTSFGNEIKVLVYFIGFLFVLFLDSAVIKPIIALVIQNKVMKGTQVNS